ncbi:hypothetical protein SeMB42_g05197 [Synchytrium endobioticum]|uniref:Uncharacterized protein n=1 Tax=Synchytrium endobioticum TaxID=286115 RepID=A0A507CT39_9FUNG|nr:hypothetical protein SeLEV6574_g06813 [Synchytrium endobioticum]TPX42275.1 hypothetical protein SeMB42_g05197 [Synchytrium endobioticum]
MLSKAVVALLAASSAALVSADLKFGGYSGEKYAADTYKDGAYNTEYMVKNDGYVSDKAPGIVYDKVDYRPEYKEGVVEVPYKMKGPRYEGHIKFPSEYAKYETKSEGPYVPEMKQSKIYAPVYEKQFVCPKHEKMVVVKVPAKCACEPIEVKPKIVKAPEFKEYKQVGKGY